MTGQVLDYSVQSNEGIISGDDSHRYRFVGSDWPGATAPIRGTLVDFDVRDGNHAVSIYLIQPTTPATSVASAAPAPDGPKNRMTAAMLAWTVGVFGVHKFYLGEKGGVLRIILSCTFIGLPVSGILAALDAMKLLGMSDEQFNRQYNS